MTRMILENQVKKSIPLSRIQKLIGKRMLKSKAEKPCFYLELSADVTELMAMRPKLRKSLGVKITTNAFYIRALSVAAQRYPLIVGRVEGDNIKIADSINVGFAVNASHGLVVPVVKNANQKSLAEIARMEKQLTEKARDNQLTLDDMDNETIALSNLGSYNVDCFLGIVPPPASTILAVGNVTPQIVCDDGNFITRRILSLTLAVDHRVINGEYGAKFLDCIKEQLQNPRQLC